MDTKKFEQVDIDKLIPYIRNARTHSPEQINQIRASLREFGFVSPAVVDNDYNVIVGHGRIEAAKLEGYKEVPCVFAEELTDAQKKAYILADNRLALNAGWDEEMLAVELADLQGVDFDVSLLGFDDKEINKLLKSDDVEDDDFDVEEELKKPALTRPGDIWLIGKHRLYCGDSTKQDSYEKLMDGKLANLVVTDPPYNVNYESKCNYLNSYGLGAKRTIKNDHMSDEKFYDFLIESFKNILKNMADDASIYVFHSDVMGLIFRSAFQDADFYLSECCIWVKNRLVLGRAPYQWRHEPILYGWKKDGKHKWYADRKQSTIWEYDRPGKNDLHPTMKPVPLLAYPIENSSMTGCIVLDPFIGSGSTLIACEQTDRICYGIELDEKFCDVVVKRYAEQMGSTEGIFVLRDGKKLAYSEVTVKE